MNTDPANLMWPTLLDTKTGAKVTPEDWRSDEWFWTEGNGSCDCNRSICFSAELHDEIALEVGDPNVCFGSKRFVVIDVHGFLGGTPKQELIAEMNRGYPEDLRHFWDKSGGAR